MITRASMSRLFSNQYANQSAIGNNLLLAAMYRLSYPFALMLAWVGLTPNQITTLSVLFAMASAVSLAIGAGLAICSFFWGLAILMDFCDGTVARMTGNVRSSSFRYDHSSDLFKIFLMLVAVGIRYEEFAVWVSSMSASFTFMFYMVMNHDLGTARRRISQLDGHSDSARVSTVGISNDHRSKAIKGLKAVYAAFMTINGHTLLLFFLLPIGQIWAVGALLYLAFVSGLGTGVRIAALCKIPK